MSANSQSSSSSSSPSQTQLDSRPRKRTCFDKTVSINYDEDVTTLEAALEKERVDLLDPEQLERYERCCRSRIHGDAIKRIIEDFFEDTDGSYGNMKIAMNQEMIIMLQGLAKLYVGSLVETARAYKEGAGESGPLMPRDYQEAYTTLRMARSSSEDGGGRLMSGRVPRLLHGAPQAEAGGPYANIL